MSPGTGHLTDLLGGKRIKNLECLANLIKTAQTLTKWRVRKFWKWLQSKGKKNGTQHTSQENTLQLLHSKEQFKKNLNSVKQR